MMNQRGFSLINIAGLTMGMTCTLMLVLYIQDELGFDSFHSDSNRIYRIVSQGKLQGEQFKTAETGARLAKAIQQQLPEVESVVRLANWPTFPINYQGNAFTEPYLLLADSNFFSFFDFRLIQGNPDEVLRKKASVVISESAAKKYFNITNQDYSMAIGEELILAQGYKARVAGIVQDPPPNSHFHFSVILSLASWEEVEINGWIDGLVKTYVKTKSEIDLTALDLKLERFVKNEIAQELKRIYSTDYQTFLKNGNYIRLYSQSLRDIHLKSHLSDEIEANNDIQYIYLFAAIALFITLLACINFVNLSTARSATRAKEVGVRKAVGARNGRLVMQFLLESYLYTIIAVILSILLIWLSILPFNLIAEKSLSMNALLHPYFLGGILFFIFVVGLFSGSYPAFFLTYFSPAQILKGSLRSGVRSHKIRNLLVGFQFIISIALIISTAVVYRQLRYIQDQHIGFERKNIINLLHTANLKEHAIEFKEQLLRQPGIVSVSFANRIPPNMDWHAVFRSAETQKDFLMGVYEMDIDHLKTMGYQLAQGTYFNGTHSDSSSVLINETAARQLGITHLNGQQLETTYHPERKDLRTIIGIIKDFNFRSLKLSIEPMIVLPSRIPNWEMAIRFDSENPGEVLEQIEAVWNKYALGAPFEYSFVEDNFQSSYKNEERIGAVFLIFTTLAIIIASLGLLGLATYTVEQRSKEIGIRKVLGATHSEIFVLIGKDFAMLVLIAFIIAAPFAWWALDWWLNQYPYRIEIPWQTIAMAGLLSFVITIISISAQTFRAAAANPIKSLRNE